MDKHLNDLVRTFVLNAIFILILPMILTMMTVNGYVLILYVLVYTVLEWMIDYICLSQKVPNPGKAFFIGYALNAIWNYILLILSSIIIASQTDTYLAMMSILGILFIFSIIEIALDEGFKKYAGI